MNDKNSIRRALDQKVDQDTATWVHKPMTLIQFESELERQALLDYPGIKRKEYIDCYPPNSRKDLWLEDMLNHANLGHPFSRAILDDIFTRNQSTFWYIWKHHNSVVPASYLNPQTRHANRSAAIKRQIARENMRYAESMDNFSAYARIAYGDEEGI